VCDDARVRIQEKRKGLSRFGRQPLKAEYFQNDKVSPKDPDDD
jgi:hypothetical protein